MSLGVSIVICCYNSAKRLPATLAHLARQEAGGVPWEIVVVDNASTDDTAAVARENWPNLSPVPLRVVTEGRPGLGHARLKGFREARHEIISFIDDDNWVANDWIARVSAIFAGHPEVGVSGGRSDAEPETALPSWFDEIKGFYAVGPQQKKNGDITGVAGSLLWGAGMNIRRAALAELVDHGFEFLIQDRRGSQLSTGGDTELCFVLQAFGWRLWYDDDLVLRHFIPADRLTWNYAQRLMRGMGTASVYFDLYLMAFRRQKFQNYPSWKMSWIVQFLRTARMIVEELFASSWQSLTGSDGSVKALRVESLKARLESLWEIRPRYRDFRRHITARYADRVSLAAARAGR